MPWYLSPLYVMKDSFLQDSPRQWHQRKLAGEGARHGVQPIPGVRRDRRDLNRSFARVAVGRRHDFAW